MSGAPKSEHDGTQLDGLFDAARRSTQASAQQVLAAVEAGLLGQPREPPRLDRYRLLDRIAAGGAGVVYTAHDPELDRRVAIKLLRDRGDEVKRTRQKARLVLEAKALAQLAHPNVITVFDVGTYEHGPFEHDESDGAAGGVYIVMELVSGQSLAEWLCVGGRTWRQVVDRFLAAGRGLAAAHDVGIVHRDFKPANVAVGEDGRVRVLDFGLARAMAEPPSGPSDESAAAPAPPPRELAATLDDPDATRSAAGRPGGRSVDDGHVGSLTLPGTVLGTPAYMAPEQHRASLVDARTDQYSFCVALYEGVYGHRPFQAGTLAALARAKESGKIVDAPPDTDVPPELRSVLVRGLNPDPALRFRDMKELLTTLARLRRDRRGRLVALGSLALLAAAGSAFGSGLIGSSERCGGGIEALDGVWDAGRKHAVENALLSSGVSYAADTWDRVQSGLDTYTHAWVDMRSEACEAAQLGEQTEAELDRRMTCLEGRMRAVAALVDVLSHADSSVVARAAPAVAGLGDLDRCADLDALGSRLPPPAQSEAQEVTTIRDLLARAEALGIAGKYEDGVAVAEDAVARARASSYAPIVPEAVYRLGVLLGLNGDLEGAELTMSSAYWDATSSQHDQIAADAASGLVYFVGVSRARREDGLKWARHARAAIARGGIDPRGEAILAENLGHLLEYHDQFEEARQQHERAHEINLAIDPDNMRVAASAMGIGATLTRLNRPQEALEHLDRALSLTEKALGPDHPDVAAALGTLGNAYGALARFDDARESYSRGLGILERAIGPNHPDVCALLTNMGNALEREGQHGNEARRAEAVAYQLRALAITEKLLGPDHPTAAIIRFNVGGMYLRQGKLALASDHCERALKQLEPAFGPEHSLVAFSLNCVSEARLGARAGDSVALSERAITILERGQAHDFVLAQAQFVLARALWKTERGRAHALAVSARETFAPPNMPNERASVETWLADHRL